MDALLTMVRLLLLSIFVAAGSTELLNVPSVEYSALHNRASDVQHFLGETGGILVVPGVPGYDSARRSALQEALTCLKSGGAVQEVLERRLSGGALRRSVASTTIGGSLSPTSAPGCPEFERKADVLRALVNMAAAQVVRAWQKGAESKLEPSSVLLRHERGDAFGNLAEAVSQAEHLEHFHIYAAGDDMHDTNGEAAVPLHTDAGLMLVFTAPLYEGQSSLPSGVLFKGLDGSLKMLDLPADSLAFMVGEAARWLPWEARPAPHALRLPPGSVRAWYGQMLRLPDDAVQPATFNPAFLKQPRTFGEWWHNATQALSTGRKFEDANLGCGLAETVDFEHACADGSKYCWMKCMTLPPGCTDSTAQCLHTDGTPWANQTEMCPTCTLKCPKFGGYDFCDKSAAGDMIMQGFVTYGVTGSKDIPCVILFHQALNLDTPLKFWVGVLFVFAFGILVELFTLVSHKAGCVPPFLVHAFRMTLAYLLMLGAMTYSVEIFLAVVLGLGVGHGIVRQKRKGSGIALSSATPCCDHGGETAPVNSRLADASQTSLQIVADADVARIVRLRVDGMTCGSCSNTVRGALQALSDVERAAVTLGTCGKNGQAEVLVRQGVTVDRAALLQAVDAVGFDARVDGDDA